MVIVLIKNRVLFISQQKKQLNKTIDLYFNNNTKLIILKFNVKKFGKDLKWEKSRDGQFFPHLYGLLNYDDILTYESYDE